MNPAIEQVRLLLSGSEPQPVDESVEKQHVYSRSAMYAAKEDIKQVDAEIIYNASASVYVEAALRSESGTVLTSTGALSVRSGAKTGRSPKDKRIVREPSSEENVWWGPVNIPMEQESFMVNRERAIDYLNTRPRLFVVDAWAGWDKKHRIGVRVITERAYHALFMKDMLVVPTEEELKGFTPEVTILNAGCFPANRYTAGMTSSCSIDLHLGRGEMVILGTQYAGEMKKGVLTVMMYHMPLRGLLPLHSAANEGEDGVTVFFGLSGTGKTTLSADPHRALIGDDEHVWTDDGIFNIEGGCYAKCAYLSKEGEPEIYDAIKFGSVLENCVIDDHTRQPDYNDLTVTENTRCAYPLQFIPNAKIPALSPKQPSNVILLTCDGFGVLPPISKLTKQQVVYHFLSGYTSKMAGTEVGIKTAVATFSPCYGEPFLVWHPLKYAHMLADKLETQGAHAWLLNTGWLGGTVKGRRCPLKYTRAILDAVHSGDLAKAEYKECGPFNLLFPTSCPGVPAEVLDPATAWADKAEYAKTANDLATLCYRNFESRFAKDSSPEVIAAGPSVSAS